MDRTLGRVFAMVLNLPSPNTHAGNHHKVSCTMSTRVFSLLTAPQRYYPTEPSLWDDQAMYVSVLTREYPPTIYGGAGVHVAQLVPQLRTLIDVDVQCMGQPREGATAHAENYPEGANGALRAFGADLSMVDAIPDEVDLVHSHTWYTNLAGLLAGVFHDVPHVISAHSLEPDRPWKAEQLGGGYRLSSWAEKTAYDAADAVIAVSEGMRADVLRAYPELDPDKVHVVRNGVNTDEFHPVTETDVCRDIGMDLTDLRWSSSGALHDRKDWSTWCMPLLSLILRPSSFCWPAPRIPHRLERSSKPPSRRFVPAAERRLSGCRRCSPARRYARCSLPLQSLPALRSMSHWALSTWRLWPALRR
ncbi:glycogen synthase [Cutibacterium acnes JCM 18916]|nr:glycogen synthase [Cutibacterium acnes JCM 18916]